MAIDDVTSWTFGAECKPSQDILDVLTPGEEVHAAFKTIRDIAAFTNKRLIVRDSQGITGKKCEVYSLPWTAVNMWSSENSGILDINSEIELWTRAGHIKISLAKGANVRQLDQLIAQCVCE